MLEGWLATGLSPSATTVIEPHPSGALTALAAAKGFRLAADAAGLPAAAVLVLGIKPQALAEVAPGIARLIGPETLLVSILAGKTVADLTRALPSVRAVVRAMPNLPASIGRGATGAYASPDVSPAQRASADALLSAVGIVEWVGEETLVDAVTALSGSGPAYLFHLAECMAEAGAAAGLDPALADRLARATIVGAAELMATSGLDPAELRRNVTSPGGTTAAALDVLAAKPGLAGLMRDAVLAARRRAEELSS